ncbi:MAG: hypothetical protein ACLRMX_04255 [Lachnospira eligens]
MPTDDEKKEQDAADNDISDEITDSEKADDTELTDASENTQDTADTKASDKISEKIIARKNTIQKLKKLAENLRKVLRRLTCMLT